MRKKQEQEAKTSTAVRIDGPLYERVANLAKKHPPTGEEIRTTANKLLTLGAMIVERVGWHGYYSALEEETQKAGGSDDNPKPRDLKAKTQGKILMREEPYMRGSQK